MVVATLAFLFVAMAAIGLAIVLWAPAPPRTLVMTTGAPGDAYDRYAERYREILARSGIELRLMPSAGAVENLSRLADDTANVSAGFVQDGTVARERSAKLATLGTVAYEPLWFFYRGEHPGRKLEGLHGKRIGIGPEGSGTRALALQVLALNGIARDIAQLLPLTAKQSAEQLLAGQIEAAVIVAPWDSPAVHALMASPQVEVVTFPRADAFVALYPFLSKLIVPQGVADLAQNRPPADVTVLAPKTSLVIRNDLHPALQYLLLDAAVQVHGGPGFWQKAGQFPAAEAVDLPLSEAAQQYYKSGRPFLQRYLPFWLAVTAQQLLVLMIPVIGVLYPLLRFVPTLYGWSMRRRVFALYGELKQLEREIDARGKDENRDDLHLRLARLEQRAYEMRVPVAFAHLLYSLRLHMTLVKGKLNTATGQAQPSA
jgi:TRAP transporter TAXI family solute receptor